MTKNEYNGWFNYETWCVNLWITNDQNTLDYWNERAVKAWQIAEDNPRKHFTTDENALLILSDELKDSFDENSPADVSGVYADLMNAALSEVNWRDITEHLLNSNKPAAEGN